ncbi:glycosyltransferase [Gallionella capsiferriformans]|uniref:Glycosyl transferase group 1 n=1 Tax=Gallionella capsiferriformans (strain ES-2) TaxID=395494 RepID=D9SFL6_GALCS|nr:glycosyltransferase [Gallionella capsiferriformans]ADL55313.1 glycosyl transferase group 1 [Gallionella capsiferriformans ES-2]
MKILHVIPSVDPKYGGPIEGVTQLSVVCRDLGVEVEICSLDAPDAACVRNSQALIHALGPAVGSYWYSRSLVPWLKMHSHEYDAVIVNGLWQYVGFAVWRVLAKSSTPYFVFPHGMLGPWFKHTYPLKHFKKWFYWSWAEYRVLRDARKVIFTCDSERLLARESFWLYKVNEAVSGFGVANPPANGEELAARFLAGYPHLRGKRIILFLGRIHEVKGCDLLIEAFAKISHHDEQLHLLIAGPDQIGWAAKLKAQAESSGLAHRITWPGMLQADMKWGAIYATEVFCLPSHHENFGIVVAEALACGKPVLISNKVNIWREIEADGAGLVEDDTLAGTVTNFERWLAMSQAEFQTMTARTATCFASRFHVQRAAERLLEIIRESK